jgi:hypothetical protein
MEGSIEWIPGISRLGGGSVRRISREQSVVQRASPGSRFNDPSEGLPLKSVRDPVLSMNADAHGAGAGRLRRSETGAAEAKSAQPLPACEKGVTRRRLLIGVTVDDIIGADQSTGLELDA